MSHLVGASRVYLLLILAGGVASAQIYPPTGYPPGGYPPGGYPPGGYPPGGYPGGGYPYPGGGVGVPVPGGRSKGKPDQSTKGQPLPNFRGKLKQMDNKTITLALDDDRMLIFQRNDKTKFFKAGDEVKSPQFKEGDQLSIEGPEDATGKMVAVNVYWEKAASSGTQTTQTSKNKDDGVVDTWKDAPKDAKPDSASAAQPTAPVERATEDAPPPSHDPDDPGRSGAGVGLPTLRVSMRRMRRFSRPTPAPERLRWLAIRPIRPALCRLRARLRLTGFRFFAKPKIPAPSRRRARETT